MINAQRIGDTLNPALLQQDYSGIAEAGRARGAAMAGLGAQVSGLLNDWTKEQKAAKDAIKVGESQIKAAAALFPSQAPMLEGLASELKNEDVPISQRAAIASQVGELINMSVGEKRYQNEMAMRESAETRANLGFQQDYGRVAEEMDRQRKAGDLDSKVKSSIGSGLLENVLQMVPLGIAENVRESLGDYSPEEQYGLANTLMTMIPKRDRKAPAVQDVAVPGGTMKMQWDEKSGAWTPIETNLQVRGGFDPQKLPAPLQPYGNAFAEAGAKYGVDPKVLAAISIHETGGGSSSAFKNKNNAMGVSNSKGPINTGTVEASIDQMARLLAAGQQGKGPYAGKSTIAEIAGVYAPVGAGNDPRGLNSSWSKGVSSALQKLGGDPAQPIGFKPDPAATPTISEQIQIAKFEQGQQDREIQASAAASKSAELVSLLDKLESHPGFNGLFGFGVGTSQVHGTDAASARVIYEQLEGKGFLEAIQAMKGMGALSDKEGARLSVAFLGLSPSMSEKDAKARIKEIKELVQKGMQKAGEMGAAQMDPVSAASARLRSMSAPR